MDRLYESLDNFDKAVDSTTGALPAGHMMPTALRGNRARCLIRLQRFEEAERELVEAHAIRVRALGAEHRRTQQVVRYAAELYEL